MNQFHDEQAIVPGNKDDPQLIEDTNLETVEEGEANQLTPEQKIARNKAVTKCREWFDLDREAKSAYNLEMDELYKLFKGDHWDLLDDTGQPLRNDSQKLNHPNAVENVVFAMVEGLVAEFSQGQELIDYPVEEGDEDVATLMTELKEFIAYKNRNDLEIIKWLRWFFLYGTGIWEMYFDPTWKGGKGPNRWEGDIRWQAVHPRSIFPDARCMTDFEDGRRIHKAVPRTIEDVEETWPEAENITPDFIADDILVSSELEDSSVANDEDQVLVVDTWYRGKPMICEDDEQDEGTGLHLIQWAGEGSLQYLAHSNYVNFDAGEDATFPIKGYKCYERERSPWGMGEAAQLKKIQMLHNKNAELITEGHIFEVLGQTWYEATAVTEKQKKVIQERGTLPGMWFEVKDANGIKRVYGKGIPASLQNECGRLEKMMETVIGRFDISQGKTPGSVTAFRALDLLSQRAQVRLRSKEMTIAVSKEDSGNYINKLIARNYSDKRKYRILGKDDAKPQYGTYDGANMKKAYMFDYDESISMQDLGVLTAGQEGLPEQDQLLEGRDYELYSPEFDTKCKLSSELPSDRTFYMEMAKELYGQQLIDEETFFYVMERGKFPPWEEIIQKIKAKIAASQGMPPVGPDGQPMQPGPEQAAPGAGQPQGQQLPPQEALDQFIEMLKVKHPDVLQQIVALPKEKQVPALLEIMRTMPPEMMQTGAPQAPAPQPGAEIPTGPQVPVQNDPAAIKQQLIDIVLAQKEAANIPQQ